MKSKEQINKLLEDTFNVLDTIEEVKVNHFFKHKVLQQFENQKDEKSSVFGWFTPQLQMATLSVILLLNLGTLYYAYSNDNSSSTNNIETFTQEYALQLDSNSILN